MRVNSMMDVIMQKCRAAGERSGTKIVRNSCVAYGKGSGFNLTSVCGQCCKFIVMDGSLKILLIMLFILHVRYNIFCTLHDIDIKLSFLWTYLYQSEKNYNILQFNPLI